MHCEINENCHLKFLSHIFSKYIVVTQACFLYNRTLILGSFKEPSAMKIVAVLAMSYRGFR